MRMKRLEVDWSDVACILTVRTDADHAGPTGRCCACGEPVAISRVMVYPNNIPFICLDCEIDRLTAADGRGRKMSR